MSSHYVSLRYATTKCSGDAQGQDETTKALHALEIGEAVEGTQVERRGIYIVRKCHCCELNVISVILKRFTA